MPGVGADVMFGAEKRWGDFCGSSIVRPHAQSRAEIESLRARGTYTAGCKSSPATMLRATAFQFERKRFHTAYAIVRSTKGCSMAIGRAVVSPTRMLAVGRRGFSGGFGSTGQCALANMSTITPPSVIQSMYAERSAGSMGRGRGMHGRQWELNIGAIGTIAPCCSEFPDEPMFRAS